MNQKEAIYKFDCSVGRMGDLEGLFVATQEQVDWLINTKKDVYFGEVLGKHSEIYGAIEQDDITMVSDDPIAVNVVKEHNLSTGYNPFYYCFINEHTEELMGEDYDPDWTVMECYVKLHNK